MYNSGYSLADIAAVTNNGCCNTGSGMGWGGNDGWGWIWILLIFGIFGGWGNGFGGFGGNAGGAGFQGYATRADISDGFALNGIENGIRGIQQGLCDGFYAQNTTMLQGFNGVQNSLCQGFNGVNGAITDLGYSLKDCCCQTQRAIDGVNYNMARGFSDVTNTMHNNTRDIIDNQNAGTRAILDFLTNDKIESLRAENQNLKLAASQANQNAVLQAAMDANTAEIIRRTGNDCPIPAYVVPNPNCCYGNYGFFNNNSCCGCGNV